MNRWLQLTRLQTSGITIGMLLLTRWVCTGPDVVDAGVLILAGLLVHAGFFSLNEWADRHHDEGHPHKVNPIASGRISSNRALSLSLATLTLSLALLAWWNWTWSWTSLPLISSYVMGTSYDLRSKRMPRLAPLVLSGWAFMLSLWIVGLSGFPHHGLWLPFTWGFMLYLQVLEGDLKDWEHDGRDPAGLEKHEHYMGTMQVVFLSWLLYGSYGQDTVNLVIFVGLLVVGNWVVLWALDQVHQARKNRKRMLRAMGLHNMVEYALIVVVCLLWVSWLPLLLAWAVPVVVYGGVNFLAYGQTTAPSI